MTAPDFSKIWAENTPLAPYVFSDSDYLEGWEFLGEIPPDRRMFDTWQKQADTKMLWLKNNMLGYLLRQNNKVYEVWDIAFSASLPSSLVLECTAPGTTAATEPDFSGAVEGGTVTDGGVVWTYKSLVGGGLDREQIPAFNHRDVIITSGTYTAPVDGWYKITIKGGGGGGAGGYYASACNSGGGGGEGGKTIGWEYLNTGDSVSVVVGAGGIGGTALNTDGTDGGDSSVTVNGNTYAGGGGKKGLAASSGLAGGVGGSGTIIGAPGGSGQHDGGTNAQTAGGSGGGEGGGVCGRTLAATSGTNGGGGAGGYSSINNAGTIAGADGGDGYVWFEYFAAV